MRSTVFQVRVVRFLPKYFSIAVMKSGVLDWVVSVLAQISRSYVVIILYGLSAAQSDNDLPAAGFCFKKVTVRYDWLVCMSPWNGSACKSCASWSWLRIMVMVLKPSCFRMAASMVVSRVSGDVDGDSNSTLPLEMTVCTFLKPNASHTSRRLLLLIRGSVGLMPRNRATYFMIGPFLRCVFRAVSS